MMQQATHNSKSASELSKLLRNAFLVEWTRKDGKFVADVLFRTHREAGRFEGILIQVLPEYDFLPVSSLQNYTPFSESDRSVTLECNEGTPLHDELRKLLLSVPEENRRVLDSITSLIPGIAVGEGGKSWELQVGNDKLFRVIDPKSYSDLSEDERLQFKRRSNGTYIMPITSFLACEYARSYQSVEKAVMHWYEQSCKAR